jgi:HD-like signal output (HDOD) protein
MRDPLFALRLLRKAEQVRSHQLGHETTTPLATVLQLGFKRLSWSIRDAVDADDSIAGFAACAGRSVLAAHIGYAWAAHHADISPDEVAFAALFEDIGELLLWAFVPELPDAALKALADGRARRNAEAQEMTAGFGFRGLTLELADMWQLPRLITQLIKGSDNVRANVARLATDTARHLHADPRNPAIADDLRAIQAVIPGVSFDKLMLPLNLDEDFRESVLLALGGE